VRRWVGPGLALLVAAGVIAAIVASLGSSNKPAGGAEGSNLTVVRGVIGSEKQPFFLDPRVKAEFAKHGLNVQVDTAGSRQIATSVDLSTYEFAFPSGSPAAVKIEQKAGVTKAYTAFYSPMVIASWKPIVALLQEAGVAKQTGGVDTFDLAAYLKLVDKNVRWTDLRDHSPYPADKTILVTSTDVRTSNSAAMYLSLTSYVANHDNIVENTQQADAVLPLVQQVFLKQGFLESSSEEPFDDYLSIGIGKTPMVMIYEAQFIAKELAADGSIRPDMVVMYPTPEILSKHIFIPLRGGGDRVGQLLLHDPVLERLEALYGFRTNDPTFFRQALSSHHVAAPPDPVNVIEPPAYDTLEYMITRIQQTYDKGGTP
jgi:hypothetical protein